MGHHQSFAFCSAHWVRPCDDSTRQQTPTSFLGTCSQHRHTTTTPPQLPHFYTCRRRQNTGGSTGGHRDGKRAGVPGMPTIFFYLFLFLMVFLYQHNPPSPGEYPIYLTMPRPAARHKKRAICGAFFIFGGYSLSKHKKHEHACIFRVWWVSCPLPPFLWPPTPPTCLPSPFPSANSLVGIMPPPPPPVAGHVIFFLKFWTCSSLNFKCFFIHLIIYWEFSCLWKFISFFPIY